MLTLLSNLHGIYCKESLFFLKIKHHTQQNIIIECLNIFVTKLGPGVQKFQGSGPPDGQVIAGA